MAVPAENIRTATKARIKRATEAAQRRMDKLDAEALDQLERMYRDARSDIEARIRAAESAGGMVQLQDLRTLRAQIDRRLEQLAVARDSLLRDQLVAAARLGVEPYAGVEISADLADIAEQAARFVQEFIADDGLQLSDRLWRIDAGARDAVGRAIERAVIEGYSASQAAQDYLRRGVAVPTDVQSRIAQASGSAIAHAAGRAFFVEDRNAYANARRVFRTELNRAHGTAYIEAGFRTPGVVGTRFLLSPAHPHVDICDMHAKVNRYGLGAGVYPKGKNPWPAHPNTLSYVVVVFEDEVTDADRAGATDRIAWLKTQNLDIQEAVLGSRAKAGALRQGLLRENEIATPWRVLKPRLEKRGFVVTHVVDDDKPRMPLRVPRPAGVSVREALDVRGQKRLMDEVLNAIDSVHGDGTLPRIPLLRSSGRQTLGAYWHTSSGRAVKINVSANSPYPAMTASHEIGHFLDHQAMFEPGRWASRFHDRLMGGWITAVNETRAVRTLRTMLEGPPSIKLPSGHTFTVSRAHLRYLLSVEEVWARSYAQYIAVRSGHARLVDELAQTLARQSGAPLIYPQQWEPDDFAPVAKAIDTVFESLGWRVSR
jgi:hypothetical protein